MTKYKRRKHVWIVEARYDYPVVRNWSPTVGAALTRADAVYVLSDWRRRNPDDKFRLVEYRATR